MPDFLYVAFALAALLLFTRWWYAGLILDMPCWGLYLAHLPFASLVWALQWWEARWWVSGIGNVFLLCCAFESARACGWWIIPKKERKWVLASSGGIGLLLAGLIAMMVSIPVGQPTAYFLAGACAPAAAIGVLAFAWGYQRLITNRLVNNSRFAWHAGLLAAYCALGVFNYASMGDAGWYLRTYATVTLKIAMFICWWWKVAPLSDHRALPA